MLSDARGADALDWPLAAGVAKASSMHAHTATWPYLTLMAASGVVSETQQASQWSGRLHRSSRFRRRLSGANRHRQHDPLSARDPHLEAHLPWLSRHVREV